MGLRPMGLSTKRHSFAVMQYTRCNIDSTAKVNLWYSYGGVNRNWKSVLCQQESCLRGKLLSNFLNHYFLIQVSHGCFTVWALNIWNKGCHWLLQYPVIFIAYIKFSLWWDLMLFILYFLLVKQDKNRREGEKKQGWKEERKERMGEERNERGKEKLSINAHDNLRRPEKNISFI